MRTRKDVERRVNNTFSTDVQALILGNSALVIELLLDIRDLLAAKSEAPAPGPR